MVAKMQLSGITIFMKTNKKATPLNADTTRIILESISEGVFTIDYNWIITSFDRAAEEITGITRKDAIGRRCWEVFRSNMCENNCALKRTMEEGRPFISSSGYIIGKDKKKVPVTVSTSLLINKNGKVIGGVETFTDHSVVEQLRKELSSGFKMEDIVSCSNAMKNIFKILPQIADSDSSVLIEGETGTGKELLARAIHNMSPRKEKPFMAINCGALPDTLLESELFGYKKGAFTNAVKDKPGQFALADGGTIFLDEIGDTSPAFQVSLLRVLQEHEFTPLGALNKEKANIRIIAATNQDLSSLVADNRFRQDLYYRINVIRLALPPLRQRMEDIPLLVDEFVHKMNIRQGKLIQGVDPKVLQIFMSYDFPGNIRELENIIEHAFVLCSEGHIKINHLPDFLSLPAHMAQGENHGSDPVKSAQIQIITDALARNNYNRTAAAKDLGIHKSTLFRRIKKLGIKL
jgi:PAS domain S-box-containing protein